jgi:cerevisin
MRILYIFPYISCLDNYIVMFKRRPHLTKFQAALNYENNIIKATKYFSKNSRLESNISNGFVAQMDRETVNKLKNDDDIELVEKDSVVKITDYKVLDLFITQDTNKFQNDTYNTEKMVVQDQAPWGLSRILGKSYLKSHKYIYPENAGKDVEVYVIDTGINILHPDFGGRARWGANMVESSVDKDENGHGTHVAGIIGGSKYGISKSTNLVAVKVLDSNGVGMVSRILKGIDFVITEHEKKKDVLYDLASAKYLGNKYKKNLEQSLTDFINDSDLLPKTVVNMSVGGAKSMALNFALDYASSLGIHFAVAAGNDHENACSYSPGSSKHAITIGASDIYDTTADFSNYGSCVDIFAPGVDILSAWNDDKFKIASGTSMASPHVAGVMSLYLGFKRYTPEKLKNKILSDSKHVIEFKEHNDSVFRVLWPLNWFNKEEKLPLVSINNFIKKLIGEEYN